MSSTNTCPHCGRVVSTAQSFCPSCGGRLKSSGGLGWKLLLGALAAVIGVAWVAFYTQASRQVTPATPPVQFAAGSNLTPLAAPLELTSAQHLAEAKRALADGYKPNKDPKKATWGEVEAARWHLKSIAPSAQEYRDAQELVKEVARREQQRALAAKALAAPQPTPETAQAEGESGGLYSSPSPAPRALAAPSSAAPSANSANGYQRVTTPSAAGGSSDYYINRDGQQVHRPTFSDSAPAGASAQCRDGSYSFSLNRRGTCSHHGGVAKWL